MKTEFDKMLSRNINKIKKATSELRKYGFAIETVETESMMGEVINHHYLIDKLPGGAIMLQKHLYSTDLRTGLIR